MASKEFSKKLKELRLRAGYSQKQVYEHFNIPQSTFSSWEVGKSEPSGEMLVKLCKYYGCDILKEFSEPDNSITYAELEIIKKYRSLDPFGQESVNLILERELSRKSLLDEKDRQIFELEASHNESAPTRIYTYLNKIACAGKGFYFEDIPTATMEAPYMEDADFIVGVSGSSMEPTYYDGDKVYVHRCQIVNIGDIGIFYVNGDCLIKEAGDMGLISHNPAYSMIPGSDNIICVGKVLGKVDSQN